MASARCTPVFIVLLLIQSPMAAAQERADADSTARPGAVQIRIGDSRLYVSEDLARRLLVASDSGGKPVELRLVRSAQAVCPMPVWVPLPQVTVPMPVVEPDSSAVAMPTDTTSCANPLFQFP
jgi:hypothetical protein